MFTVTETKTNPVGLEFGKWLELLTKPWRGHILQKSTIRWVQCVGPWTKTNGNKLLLSATEESRSSTGCSPLSLDEIHHFIEDSISHNFAGRHDNDCANMNCEKQGKPAQKLQKNK
jgi:hypothetical protein